MCLQQLLPSALAVFAVFVAAHPEGHKHETLEATLAKREYLTLAGRDLESCSGLFERNGLNDRAKARRAKVIDEHRQKLSLKQKRNTTEILNTSHLYNGTFISPETPDVAFAGDNHVLLNPYGDNGPYYVRGELIREDVREDEPGITIIVEGQFVDYISCEPVPGMWWDLWNANSTGVYGGVINEGNGNWLDESNLNKTALRGLQQADEDGVAQITTIFPGHYTGRTNHIHIIAHQNVTVLPNNTITGGSVTHIGQFFFDQSLIDEVEQTYPYNTNTYAVTLNSQDDTFHQESAYSASDPVFHYEYLGDSIEDGLFLWVRIGVNTSASWDDEYSFVHTADGDVYSCGTGRIGANYTQSGNCTNNIDVKDLPGESGPGPTVYPSSPEPSSST